MSNSVIDNSDKQKRVCKPVELPTKELQTMAVHEAVKRNPANFAPIHNIAHLIPDLDQAKPEFLIGLTTKIWSAKGVQLTVSFLDNPEPELRKKILSHMNAWSEFANVRFVEAAAKDGRIRVIRDGNGLRDGPGYWEYEGVDITQLEANYPTMCLQDFTLKTDESEFTRVVRHEAGHALGFHHEHLRKELVDKIDPKLAIDYYWDTNRWPEAKTRAQVLTPIEESSLRGSPWADPNSIMCYQIPSAITKDHVAIPGGRDIDDVDKKYAAAMYPKTMQVPEPD